jgi:hypothetical protein
MESKILSKEDLGKFSSIVQTKPMERPNMKYSFIPTTQIIEDFEKQGWFPVDAQEASSNGANAGFQKHLIRFANPDLKNEASNFQPNAVLTNAHNGSASAFVWGGGVNFVCLNGMVVAENIIANHKIRHQGHTEEDVKTAIDNIVENMPKIYNSIDRFQSIILSEAEQRAFGVMSMRLFYDEPQLENLNLNKTAELVTAPKRKAEQDNSLWSIFNVVQENMIRGGDFLVNKASGKVKSKRPTSSIDTNTRINTELWEFAEEVASEETALVLA